MQYFFNRMRRGFWFVDLNLQSINFGGFQHQKAVFFYISGCIIFCQSMSCGFHYENAWWQKIINSQRF